MFISCTHFHTEQCLLQGKWKSNEKLTLVEMKKAEGLSQRQIDFLSNNFFGKLEVEFTSNRIISKYEGDITKQEYKVKDIDGDFITISIFEEGLDEDCNYAIKLKGDCYYIPLPILCFREVMCKIND
jgi:hypothetical protein